MRKNYKTKSMVQLLITLMLMATLLLGCSSAETETETAEAKPEVEATTTEPAKVEEEAPAEETKPEETKTTEAEAETEPTEEEPAEEVAEAPPINYEPVELIQYDDFEGDSVEDYFSTIDPDQAAIIIWNPERGYLINMKEGQYYQLQSKEVILFNFSLSKDFGMWDMTLGDTCVEFGQNAIEPHLDYSKMQPKHEFFFEKTSASGKKTRITCYLDPPAEHKLN